MVTAAQGGLFTDSVRKAVHTCPLARHRAEGAPRGSVTSLSLRAHSEEGAEVGVSLQAPAFLQPVIHLPSEPLFPKQNAAAVIRERRASHFRFPSCCSPLAHAATRQAWEGDKVNLDSANAGNEFPLWQNSHCNRSDKRKIGRAHSKLLGMFSKDKYLFIRLIFFFLKTRSESAGRLPKPRARFISQDRESGNGMLGLPHTCREGPVPPDPGTHC